MALGTRVYNRTVEKQIWMKQVEQALVPEKRYQRYDGALMAEHQIKDAYQRASHAVHSSPKMYQCGDGRTFTKYDIKAALRYVGRTYAKHIMEATIKDVEDFLEEERVSLLLLGIEDEKLNYRPLMAQTAPSGFAKPVEEKRLDQDFVLRFPEYKLSGCFCMN